MRFALHTWVGAAVLAASIGVLAVLSRPADSQPAALNGPAKPWPAVLSQAGTEPDGRLPQDAGALANADTLRFFDYYLAAMGETDLASIRAQIEREIDQRMPAEARAAAKRLLGRYLDFKLALANVEGRGTPGATGLEGMRQRFAVLREVRKRYFSEQEIAGLFGASDAYDSDAIARLEISQDKQLSAVQKRERLAALDAAMTPALRAAREAPLAVVRADEEVRDLRTRGASEAEIYNLRATRFSPEAAVRLAEVDREEADWKARIGSYLAERVQAGDNAVQLQALRDKYFTAAEQKRLVAYENQNR